LFQSWPVFLGSWGQALHGSHYLCPPSPHWGSGVPMSRDVL
jgi:hypothetical protein